MPAMHDTMISIMEDNLATMRDTMLKLLPFDMTHEECLQLIAPSDHIDILTSASKYADVVASESWIYLSPVPATIDGEDDVGVNLLMRTHGEKSPPLKPRYPSWQAGKPGGEKVIQWLTKRYELGRKFGTARHVLYWLNKSCETGQQARNMLPAILHLCKAGQNDRMDRWMAKYAAFRPCRFMPGVSPELKKAIQDTSALLTSCALLGDDVPDRVPGEVLISQPSMPHFWIGDNQLVSRI